METDHGFALSPGLVAMRDQVRKIVRSLLG